MSTNRQITHERFQSCLTVLCACGWNHGMIELEDRKKKKTTLTKSLLMPNRVNNATARPEPKKHATYKLQWWALN
jgi:hypothetical protein